MGRRILSIGLVTATFLISSSGTAQDALVKFQLPKSTGPFIPKTPRPMDKHRVDCGDGTYAEGKPITVNGKKGMMYNCSH